jgi:hypothetical protein
MWCLQVDINEAEPLFLKGHTARSGQEMSPVRVVKNPDGSMQRAALTQTALSKERREIKRQNERREMEAVPTEMSKPWEDPLAQSERYCTTLSLQLPQQTGTVEQKLCDIVHFCVPCIVGVCLSL